MPTVDPNPKTLNVLVKTRLAELGISYGEAARRGGLPKATIANLASQPLRQVPRAGTLIGLAEALSLPISTIQEAVAACVGLTYTTTPDCDGNVVVKALIATVDRLPPDDQQTLARVAESLLLASQHRSRQLAT